jgi:hypothetical protein
MRHVGNAGVALDTGIGDQDIHAAKHAARKLEQVLDLRFGCNVGLAGKSAYLQRLKLGHRLLGPVVIADVVHDDVGTGPAQLDGDGLTNAGAGAGDNRLLT